VTTRARLAQIVGAGDVGAYHHEVRSVARLTALAMVLSLACSGGENPERAACESAVSKLAGCCSSVDKDSLGCGDNSSGCGESGPFLSSRASACIQAESCATLEAYSVCSRMAAVSKTPSGLRSRSSIEEDACRAETERK
jgi:hypothetical protein